MIYSQVHNPVYMGHNMVCIDHLDSVSWEVTALSETEARFTVALDSVVDASVA